ncbi:CCC motif membrane protein [uncultured Polaribacter sp.]|uniref:CCC motif membrane protein n=1 Tax=uncultured Polaribacter sp. TaxID=174711 RepID=UPI00262F9811|nr:CCC motif membrane protein [uncultured Polaribacter sp.]
MERQKLPNATTSLVLGILSLVTCICYGVFGLPLGIIAFVLGNNAMKVYNENPDNYISSGNASAGRIIGIIGTVINLIFILTIVYVLYKIGFDALKDPELMQQRVNEIFGA